MDDVAIIGCGPVGATMANLLGQAGLKTVIHEANNSEYPLPRACHLDAEIMRIFQGIDLSEKIVEIIEPSHGMEFVDSEGNQLFDYEDFERDPILGWNEDYVFQQPQLDRILREGIARWPNVELSLGSEIRDINDLDARYIVACDGASSQIRESLGIELIDFDFDQTWLVVDLMIEDDPGLPSIIQQVCDSQRPSTYVPSAHGHHRWEFRIFENEEPEDFKEIGRVRELLENWIDSNTGKIVRVAPYRFHAVVADKWHLDNVFLAGDAAHQMPPFMGQGMCSGIRDASNLAWKLKTLIKEGAGEKILESYEEERRPHVEDCIKLSVTAGELVTSDNPVFPKADINDPERWSRLPSLKSGIFSDMEDERIGHQARQPEVSHRGQRILLDRVGGNDWYLVSSGPSIKKRSWCQMISKRDLGGHDREVDLLLKGNDAVLIRPDRYIFGFAKEEKIKDLLDEAEKKMGM